MTNNKKIMLAASAALLVAACGSSSSKADSGAIDAKPGADAPAPDAAGPPAPPTLGAQIDRMGRPAINTALNHTFDPNAATKGPAKDAYNQAADPTQWGTSFAPEFAKNLAILDALDATCGNQLLAGPTANATRYAPLAGALSDDELYVDASHGSCAAYLAVEANALGVLANTECGGRTPSMDVIDTSYSVLAAGALSGVGDGINSDADGVVDITTFPFLAAPN
jgi:hypothetical protein